MKTLSKYKNYLLVIFLIMVILELVYFGLVRQHDIIVNQEEVSFLWHYITLLALIFFTFIFFVIAWNQVNAKVIEEIGSFEARNNDAKFEKEDEQKTEHEEELKKEKTEIKFTASEIFPSGEIKDIEVYCDKILTNISKKIQIAQGLIFLQDKKDKLFKLKGKYAFVEEKNPVEFKEGETLPGQVVKDKKTLNVKNLPKDYILVFSGLGETNPQHLLIVPILKGENVYGVVEISTFSEIDEDIERFIEKVSELMAEKLVK